MRRNALDGVFLLSTQGHALTATLTQSAYNVDAQTLELPVARTGTSLDGGRATQDITPLHHPTTVPLPLQRGATLFRGHARLVQTPLVLLRHDAQMAADTYVVSAILLVVTEEGSSVPLLTTSFFGGTKVWTPTGVYDRIDAEEAGASPRGPRVDVVSIDPSWQVDRADLEKRVHAARDTSFQACYATLLQTRPDARGDAVVVFNLSGGALANQYRQSGSLEDEALVKCLGMAMKKAGAPNPGDLIMWSITMRLEFTPGG